MPEVKLTFKSDIASATKGINVIKSSLDGLKKANVAAGDAIKKSFLAMSAGLATIGAAAVKGTKDIIDFSGEIKDIADSTGASIQEITILREQFQQAGVDTDRLQQSLATLNSKLENPSTTTLEWLEKLGLDSEKLLEMDPAARFEAVGKAIGNVSDAAVSLAASKDLFGKVGADLNRLFADSSSRENAIRMLGQLPETMRLIGPTLEQAGDKFEGVGVKWKQFFSGFASQLLDPIEKAGNFIEGLDLTQLGVKAGVFVNNIIKQFQSGELTTTLISAFVGAVTTAAVEIGIILTYVIGKAFTMGFRHFIDSSPDLKILSATANAVGLDPNSKYRFTNTAEQKAKVNSVGDLMRLDILGTTANENYYQEQDAGFEEFRDFVKNDFLKGLTQFSNDAVKPLIDMTRGLQMRAATPLGEKGVEEIRKQIAEANAKAAAQAEAAKKSTFTKTMEENAANTWAESWLGVKDALDFANNREKTVEGAYKDMEPVVSSLGRIGGARGETNNVINFQNKSLQYQKEIANNTAKMTGGALIGG